MMSKPTPTWQGMPIELKVIITNFLNVTDRCILREVSKSERMLADSIPNNVAAIDILANTTTLVISVEDADGCKYVLPAGTAISHLILIFKNPYVNVRRMTVRSGRDAFGENLRELFNRIQEAGVQANSLRVTEFTIQSDEYMYQRRIKYCDTADMIELRNMMELCDPATLNRIFIDAKTSNDLFMEFTRTEQWFATETIQLGKNELISPDLLNNWGGRYLRVNGYDIELIRKMAPKNPLFERLVAEFRTKPLGSSFRFHCNVELPLYPKFLLKVDDPNDRAKSLYVFYLSPMFVRGFVRENDGTPEGRFELDALTERRQYDQTPPNP